MIFMRENSHQILLSPFFLLGLFLLLLNDFVLKSTFHNFFTGKLSDFAGLFVFPLFFAAFFPKRKLFVYFSTAFLFVFWKSSFSQGLIDLWDSFQFFKIGRTIDYTDLSALLILPLSYFYFKTEIQKQKTFLVNFTKRVCTSFVILLSVFTFTATTLVKDRDISLDEDYVFKMDKSRIASILKQNSKVQNLRIETDADKYWVEFSLEQKFCDSERPRFQFLVEQKKKLTLIRAVSVKFECKLYEANPNTIDLANQQKQELKNIFENEITEKLRQNISQ